MPQGRFADPSCAGAFPRTNDDIESISDRGSERLQKLDWRGQIGVGEENQLPGSGFHSLAYRNRLACMWNIEHADDRTALLPGSGPNQRVVRAAVVDDQELDLVGLRSEEIQHGADCRVDSI